MQVAIAARHGELRSDLQQIIEEKAQKLLTYFDRVIAIEVTVDFEGGRVKVEILVDAEHHDNFVSHENGDDVLACFHAALHKMEQQLKRYKEKRTDHRRDVPIKDLPIEELEQEQE
ncbi:ribosome hibernation promoting factor HPF [Polystyrenella longa]|uniref:Ribosome hibernation promoting factor HPF n=1 Tax=Polystyrenella longa TaxID=2528007 RepID=A0A518CJR9_9PLAN|nr:ribosome-associated translation inhibitor RaiA [Polystyrenella longa]QDU79471.1 ribosome hibernation promoting factor HPF [Polystyrenella longa]